MGKSALHSLVFIVVLPLGLTLSSLLFESGGAKDWIIAASHPNFLYVIDGSADQIIKQIPLQGPGYPFQIAVDSKQKRAYVITNRWESIAFVDLEAGKEVDSIELSRGGEKIKALAIEVNPQGDMLYIYETVTLWALDRVEVKKPRIEVIELRSKKSLKVFEMPRQVTVLAFAPDGKTLYAVAQDIYVVDSVKAEVIKTIPLKHVGITGLGEPDILTVWPNYEQTNILSIVYSVETRLKPGSPLLGIVNLDLTNGLTDWIELEPLKRIIFNSVISPTRKKAYMVYTTLSEVDLDKKRVEKTIDLDHTYYAVNISSDGKKLYLGGAQPDIAVYDAETLKQIKKIRLRGDQSIASLRIIRTER